MRNLNEDEKLFTALDINTSKSNEVISTYQYVELLNYLGLNIKPQWEDKEHKNYLNNTHQIIEDNLLKTYIGANKETGISHLLFPRKMKEIDIIVRARGSHYPTSRFGKDQPNWLERYRTGNILVRKDTVIDHNHEEADSSDKLVAFITPFEKNFITVHYSVVRPFNYTYTSDDDLKKYVYDGVLIFQKKWPKGSGDYSCELVYSSHPDIKAVKMTATNRIEAINDHREANKTVLLYSYMGGHLFFKMEYPSIPKIEENYPNTTNKYISTTSNKYTSPLYEERNSGSRNITEVQRECWITYAYESY